MGAGGAVSGDWDWESTLKGEWKARTAGRGDVMLVRESERVCFESARRADMLVDWGANTKGVGMLDRVYEAGNRAAIGGTEGWEGKDAAGTGLLEWRECGVLGSLRVSLPRMMYSKCGCRQRPPRLASYDIPFAGPSTSTYDV